MAVLFSPSSLCKVSALVSHRRNDPNPTHNYQRKLLIKPAGNKQSPAFFKCSQDYCLPSSLRQTKVTPAGLGRPNAFPVRAELAAPGSKALGRKIADFTDAFWRFLRPHTIRGTVIGSTVLVARAWIENANLLNWSLPLKAFFGLITLICANGFIVGINEIYDVEIDKVNKPYLPIASGEFSIEVAWLLVITMALTGAAIIWMLNSGPFILLLYSLSLFLGIIYSVPPIRMKRFPAPAFLIIMSFRGFLLNYGVHYATRATLGLPFEWSLPVAFITTFIIVFALVISITKDLSDVEGDRKFKVPTFATKVGVRNMAFFGSGLLLLNYVGAIMTAILFPEVFRPNFMIPAHVVLALCLIFQAWVLEQKNYTKEASTIFYQFIWKLFYAEYLIFPFI